MEFVKNIEKIPNLIINFHKIKKNPKILEKPKKWQLGFEKIISNSFWYKYIVFKWILKIFSSLGVQRQSFDYA